MHKGEPETCKRCRWICNKPMKGGYSIEVKRMHWAQILIQEGWLR